MRSSDHRRRGHWATFGWGLLVLLVGGVVWLGLEHGHAHRLLDVVAWTDEPDNKVSDGSSDVTSSSATTAAGRAEQEAGALSPEDLVSKAHERAAAGRYDDAIDLLEEARESAAPRTKEDIKIEITVDLMHLYVLRTDITHAFELLREARRIAERSDSIRVKAELACGEAAFQHELDQYAKARMHYSECELLSGEIGAEDLSFEARAALLILVDDDGALPEDWRHQLMLLESEHSAGSAAWRQTAITHVEGQAERRAHRSSARHGADSPAERDDLSRSTQRAISPSFGGSSLASEANASAPIKRNRVRPGVGVFRAAGDEPCESLDPYRWCDKRVHPHVTQYRCWTRDDRYARCWADTEGRTNCDFVTRTHAARQFCRRPEQ